MTAWWQGRMASLDLETTGVDVETARIVTAAVAMCGAGEETRTGTWLIDPGVEIPEQASAIHGVTTERARAEGDEAGPAISEILTMLSDRPDGVPLVVFNARYDLTILDREARRHGLNPLGTLRPLQVIDPLVLDKHLDRYRKGSRKLEAICEHRDATLDGAHDAAHDAIAAARLAFRIGQRGEVVRRVRNAKDGREKAALVREWEHVRHDLDRLHEFQARIAFAEAVRLAEYFRSKGQLEDAAGVRPEWPVVPVEAARVAA